MMKNLPGLLLDEKHALVWDRRDEFIADANIPLKWLYTSISNEFERDYVHRARPHTSSCGQCPKLIEDEIWGLCYAGKDFSPPVMTRMSSLTGVCLRNFIQARIVPMNRLITDIENGENHWISVVAIPDFHSGLNQIPAWKATRVYSWLLDRWTRELQTVIGVLDIEQMTKDWGLSIWQHIESYFEMVTA
jgi:hypothetical protein